MLETTKMPLQMLPNELLLLIASRLTEPDINAFSRTNPYFHAILTPYLCVAVEDEGPGVSGLPLLC